MGLFSFRKPAGSYHHGNLKETLLDVAEAMIAERGPAGLSLSEMARMAGVSSAAIYRHYADLDRLIGAVAHRGFDDFAARLRGASAAAQSGPAGFRAMGSAYLAFARERPGAYAAMFSSPVTCTDPDLVRAGQVAFETLVKGLQLALRPAGLRDADCTGLAVKVWSLAHGIATLTGAGRLGPDSGVVPETVLDEGVTAMIGAALRETRG